MKRGEKVAKRPNLFYGTKQEKKKPKSSYLASNRLNYQPCASVQTIGNVSQGLAFASSASPPAQKGLETTVSIETGHENLRVLAVLFKRIASVRKFKKTCDEI